MITVNFHIGSTYPVNRAKLRQAVTKLLVKHDINHAELEVTIVGSRKMRYYNEEIVHHQGITDVLSFPHHDQGQLHDFPLPPGLPPQLGEVVICYPVAVQTARKRGKLVDDQIVFYLEHGLMHLLGHHHNDGMS